MTAAAVTCPRRRCAPPPGSGRRYVIRQKIPRTGVTRFDDLVYGHIEVNNSEMDDQILIKTDGMPHLQPCQRGG